ncbi:hypothetical protein PQR75_43365 [Paraburkholderia fungorum]|uniref:hypothetical protein n=1 Tax=Paraburkholderia fungorum TaxID=134537 RepID=UPI0038B79F59
MISFPVSANVDSGYSSLRPHNPRTFNEAHLSRCHPMMFQTVEKHCNPALGSKDAASCRDTPGVDGRFQFAAADFMPRLKETWPVQERATR